MNFKGKSRSREEGKRGLSAVREVRSYKGLVSINEVRPAVSVR